MNRNTLRTVMTQLHGSQSRRQVLSTIAKATVGGVGAAVVGPGLGGGLMAGESALAALAGGVVARIVDYAFEPAALEIPAGTEVTWANNGYVPHTATSDDGAEFNSGRLDPGGTFRHLFTAAGTYPYHCEFHPYMVGAITVTDYGTGGPGPQPYVRRNVHGLDPNGPALTAYADAVAAMKALPNTDPLSWAYQGNIHRTWASPPPPEPAPTSELPGWSTCEHSNLFFWPWHRMYLYWFERIIREMSGDATFALPYWDYSDPSRRVLPAPFRDPTSPLFTDQRNPGINSETPPGTGDESTFGHCGGLSATMFNFAGSGIEGTPHAGVHIWVGGLMGGFQTAGRDPIFWLHHANIDRLWESWLALGNANPSDPTWLDNDFNSVTNRPYDFFDEAGNQVTTVRVVNEVLTTADLSYTYEALADLSMCPEFLTAPPGGDEAVSGTPVATPEGTLELGGSAPEGGIEVGPAPTTVAVSLSQPEAAVAVAAADGATVLTVEGIEGAGVPAVAVQVYINLPPGQPPDIRSPYYVGNLNLFGLLFPEEIDNEMSMPGMTQQFNIARNVAALEAIGEWTGELEVTLVPQYLGVTGAPEAAGATPEAAALPEGPWVTVESVSVSAG